MDGRDECREPLVAVVATATRGGRQGPFPCMYNGLCASNALYERSGPGLRAQTARASGQTWPTTVPSRSQSSYTPYTHLPTSAFFVWHSSSAGIMAVRWL